MSCVICNSPKFKNYDTENGYAYMQCSVCTSIFLYPRLDSTNRDLAVSMGVHPGEKALLTTGKYYKNKQKEYGTVLKKLGLDYTGFNISSCLDIGAGYGEWVLLLRNKLNAKCYAIEPQTLKREKLISKDIPCWADIKDVNMQFDTISLLNVFSHLLQPIDTIKKIHTLLNQNGFFIVQTGNTSHLKAHQHPKPYLAPDHLQFSTKESLANLLENQGFKIIKTVEMRTQNHYLHRQFYKAVAKWVLQKIPFSNLCYANKVSDLWVLCQKV